MTYEITGLFEIHLNYHTFGSFKHANRMLLIVLNRHSIFFFNQMATSKCNIFTFLKSYFLNSP